MSESNQNSPSAGAKPRYKRSNREDLVRALSMAAPEFHDSRCSSLVSAARCQNYVCRVNREA